MADIKTKDGIIIKGIPDGQEMSQPIRDYVANLRASGQGAGEYNYSQSPQNQQSMQTRGTPVQPKALPQEVPTPAQNNNFVSSKGFTDFMKGTTAEGVGGALVRELSPVVTATAVNPALGAAVTGAKVVGDPIVDIVNHLFGDELQAKFGQQLTRPSDALTILFDKLGVASPESEAEKVIQSMAQATAETAGTMGLGQTLQAGKSLAPSVKKGVGQVLTEAPKAQLLSAAGSAGATETAAALDAPVPVQIAAGIGGGLLGGAVPNATQTRATQAPLKEATELGVDLMTSDVIKPNTFMTKWVQGLGEKIPLTGTGSKRAVQQTQRIKAIQNTMAEFGVEELMDLSEDLTADVFKKYKGRLNGLSNSKMEVIDKLTDNNKLVPMDNALKSIDSKIANIDQLNDPQLDSLKTLLVNKREALQNQNLSNVEIHRGLIGDFFDTNKDNKAIQRLRKDVISGDDGLYSAVNKDMEAYIKANGDPSGKDLNKWKVANKQMSTIMKEANNSSLSKILNNGEVEPELAMKMLMKKEQSNLDSLYKNLTPTGRKTAQKSILMNALESSLNKETGVVSPERFTNALESKALGKQVRTFFKGDDAKTIDGLTRVMNATRQANRAKAMPPTGAQLAPYLTAGAAAKAAEMLGLQGTEGIIGTAGLALGTGALASMYESKAVRNLLVKLATSKPGTPGEAEIFRILNETLTRTKETNIKQERSIPKEQ